MLRLLNRYRPYICPFELLLQRVPREGWSSGRSGATVLDVGCGGGLLLAILSATGRLKLGVGFDSSGPAIAAAQAVGLKECRFIRLDAQETWPAEPTAFDVVSIVDVMHHVPVGAQRGLIATAARRVAPGGHSAVQGHVPATCLAGVANRLHDLVLARQWISYCPIEQVEAWAREAGLTLEHAENANRWWYGHELRVFRRGPVAGVATR